MSRVVTKTCFAFNRPQKPLAWAQFEAFKRSRQVIGAWETLHSIVERHEDTIRREWDKK